MLVQVPYSIGGSGSAYITGFCDKYWKAGMSAEECRDYVTRAVSHAMARDGSSGGCIRLVTIDKNGPKAEFIAGTNVQQHGGDRDVPLWTGFNNTVEMTT